MTKCPEAMATYEATRAFMNRIARRLSRPGLTQPECDALEVTLARMRKEVGETPPEQVSRLSRR